MNFEEVLACLEDADTCKEIALRLKKSGKNSMPFLNIRDALVELKMNQTPRGIDDTTIMQHTFRYTQVDECFQQFRLVSKSWKHAIETMRFNRKLPFASSFFHKMNRLPVPYVQKYLQAFRKMDFDLGTLEEMDQHSLTMISDSVTKLNCVEFTCDNLFVYDLDTSFMMKILQNSSSTLQIARIPILSILGDTKFSKLTKLVLTLSQSFIQFTEFSKYFPTILEKNIENVEVVALHAYDEYNLVCEYIADHYAKHCISSEYPELNNVPVNIITQVGNLQSLESQKYAPMLQYLQIIIPYMMSMESEFGWDRFQEIFDQLINLKAIEFYYNRNEYFIDSVSKFPPEREQLWRSRLAYFQKRGINLVKRNEIRENKNLRLQLAKEAGISWRFHFF